MSVHLIPTDEADSALVANGSPLTPSFASNDGFTVSLWVYFDSLPTSDDDFWVVWWYGHPDTGNNWVRLEVKETSGHHQFRVRAGGTYSGIGLTTLPYTTLDVQTGTWYLVTFKASYDGGSELLTHTLYANALGQTSAIAATQTNSQASAPTPTFERFTLGRIGKSGADPTRRADCYVEQVAVWERPLAQSEHEEMLSSSATGFTGLPRSPDALSAGAPDLAWWVLAGHYRHSLEVDDSQDDDDAGDRFNEATTANQPNMTVDDPESNAIPTWSVNTPAVFFPPPPAVMVPKRPSKRAARFEVGELKLEIADPGPARGLGGRDLDRRGLQVVGDLVEPVADRVGPELGDVVDHQERKRVAEGRDVVIPDEPLALRCGRQPQHRPHTCSHHAPLSPAAPENDGPSPTNHGVETRRPPQRTHLRGHEKILKRVLIHTAACNLSLLMRKLFGVGTPRGLQGLAALIASALALFLRLLGPSTGHHRHERFASAALRLVPVIHTLFAKTWRTLQRAASPAMARLVESPGCVNRGSKLDWDISNNGKGPGRNRIRPPRSSVPCNAS